MRANALGPAPWLVIPRPPFSQLFVCVGLCVLFRIRLINQPNSPSPKGPSHGFIDAWPLRSPSVSSGEDVWLVVSAVKVDIHWLPWSMQDAPEHEKVPSPVQSLTGFKAPGGFVAHCRSLQSCSHFKLLKDLKVTFLKLCRVSVNQRLLRSDRRKKKRTEFIRWRKFSLNHSGGKSRFHYGATLRSIWTWRWKSQRTTWAIRSLKVKRRHSPVVLISTS